MTQSANPEIAELPSQILPRHPYLFGPLGSEAIRTRATAIELELFPAEPTETANGTLHAEPPIAAWTCKPSGRSGPLSTMSFLALWSQDIRQVRGMEISLKIHSPLWLSACQFVCLHPSGFPQAIGYDRHTQVFSRQILYPIER